MACLFGDLIILPILNTYPIYYGGEMMAFLAVTFYIAMVAAALVCGNSLQGARVVAARASYSPREHSNQI